MQPGDWIACLRQTNAGEIIFFAVFIKDHKVDNLVVFPAAAFVEMVLEAGTELFNGHPFTVEDFEIRKPLILPENVATIVLGVVCVTSIARLLFSSAMRT